MKGKNVLEDKQEILFNDFAFFNPEIPGRDREILKEIEDHRQIVQTQIELKRHSYQKMQSSLQRTNDLVKSQTEIKSLKMQVLQH